jgi:Uma2 family endonuclease
MARLSARMLYGDAVEDDMAAPARAPSGSMQTGEFLKFLKFRPKRERWQLIEGVAVMMNPPTLRHQVIAHNLLYLRKEALERKALGLLALVESGVRVPGATKFQPRPDVVVIPEIVGDQVYAERFFLVAEMLSPSNTKSLIAQKLRRYKEHPDNLYCLVIDSRRTWMQIHARSEDWQPVTFEHAGDVIELPEFALRWRLGDLYRRTPLDPRRSEGKDRPRSR